MGSENLLPWFAWGAPRVLFVLGLGFLVANLKVAGDLIRYRRHRRATLLTWPGQRPTYFFAGCSRTWNADRCSGGILGPY